MKKKKILSGQNILLLVLIICALVAILPIILVLIASFTDESELIMNGFQFFPKNWSLSAWKYVLTMKEQLLLSYRVTIFVTLFHTVTTLLVCSMLAYTLARKQFRLRGFLSGLLLVTMLFSGGTLSHYMVNTTIYHLKDTVWIMCIPAVGAMNVFMMRTYIQSNITDALIESAKIDGAGEFRIYAQICLPLMPPVMAALGFMTAVGKWNDWQTGMLYITNRKLVPLQLLLMRIQNNLDFIKNSNIPSEAAAEFAKNIPSEAVRMALLFTVLGPIMIAYPFFEKYFVKGLTLGAVKG